MALIPPPPYGLRLRESHPSHCLVSGPGIGTQARQIPGLRQLRLGIKSLSARNAAALNLGQALPAAILADLLGFAENTTERWTQLANGDWTRYAATRATR
jgi:hypothetical protein